ncbi:hypothetical protein JCM11251_004796 [Rhodosporidiobolus azoricus]
MSSPALDHLIVLVPHDTLEGLPPALTSAFIVTPGGTHADGLTANKLIILRDGAYIELIAFIPGQERSGHWWGAKRNGLMDFALTHPTLPSSSFPPSAYDPSQAGGRLRPDGQKVDWFVTFPKKGEYERGVVPFFCHEQTTPREVRVPLDKDKTVHPSGAVGVAGVTVKVPEGEWEKTLKVYEEVFGGPGLVAAEAVVFQVGAVSGNGKAAVTLVKSSEDKGDFGEVVLRVDEEEKPEPVEVDLDGRSFRVRFE